MTPIGAWRNTRSRASARSRAAGHSTGTPSGKGASSSTRTKRSSTMRPDLTSCIDTLLERFDADPIDGLQEDLVGSFAQFQISRRDVLDHVGDLAIGHGRTENGSELGRLVGAGADRHLIVRPALLLRAENADVADVMVAAGIDAAGNIDVQPAEVVGEIEVLEAARDLLGHRDGARIGEAAIVEAGAGGDVG